MEFTEKLLQSILRNTGPNIYIGAYVNFSLYKNNNSLSRLS